MSSASRSSSSLGLHAPSHSSGASNGGGSGGVTLTTMHNIAGASTAAVPSSHSHTHSSSHLSHSSSKDSLISSLFTHTTISATEAAYETASIVHYTHADRATLRQSTSITQDKLAITRSGPSFVQSGLSAFGNILAMRREADAGASVALGERGSDVWIGVTAQGYLCVWSGGNGVVDAAAPGTSSSNDASLIDYEHFLSDQYSCIIASCFLSPRLTGTKKGYAQFFVLTQEGHGLVYLVEIGYMLEQTNDGTSTKPLATTPLAPPHKRLGIIGHRRLVLKKAMYSRPSDYSNTPLSPNSGSRSSPFSSATISSLQVSLPTNVCYHPLSHTIMMTLDTEVYCYSAETLQTLWCINVASIILGGSISTSANEQKDEQSKSVNNISISSLSSSGGIKLDSAQKRAHAITAICFSPVLNLDSMTLQNAVRNMTAAAAAAANAKADGKVNGLMNDPSKLSVSSLSSYHKASPSISTAPYPPLHFTIGTRSGYLIRLDVTRREVMVPKETSKEGQNASVNSTTTPPATTATTTIKYHHDMKIIMRCLEHTLVMKNGVGRSGEEIESANNTGDTEDGGGEDSNLTHTHANSQDRQRAIEQRNELARIKEEERRKKAEMGILTGSGKTSAQTPRNLLKANNNTTVSSTTSSDDSPTKSDSSDIDLSGLPASPLLITSPSFDLSTSSWSIPHASLRTSAFSTAITSLTMCTRLGEPVVVVGCEDGFVHVVRREVLSAANGGGGGGDANSDASTSTTLDSKYARYLTPHPISHDTSYPHTLYYTLIDPSPHSIRTKLPSIVKISTSFDASMIYAVDAQGTMRRWSLKTRLLCGVSQTDGVLDTTIAAASTGLSHTQQDLIYPSHHSELAVLYGAGGPLFGMQASRTDLASRPSSFSIPSAPGQGGIAGVSVPPSPAAGSGTPQISMSPTALLSSGLLLPTHILLTSGTCWNLFRVQRPARIPMSSATAAAIRNSMLMASPGSSMSNSSSTGSTSISALPASVTASGLLADLSDFILAYQQEEKKQLDSYGISHGEKQRREKQAQEARQEKAKKRNAVIAEREGDGTGHANAATMHSTQYTTGGSASSSSLSPPLSPQWSRLGSTERHHGGLHSGSSMLSVSAHSHPHQQQHHHSNASSSSNSTRPTSAGSSSQAESELTSPTDPITSVTDFYGFTANVHVPTIPMASTSTKNIGDSTSIENEEEKAANIIPTPRRNIIVVLPTS